MGKYPALPIPPKNQMTYDQMTYTLGHLVIGHLTLPIGHLTIGKQVNSLWSNDLYIRSFGHRSFDLYIRSLDLCPNDLSKNRSIDLFLPIFLILGGLIPSCTPWVF